MVTNLSSFCNTNTDLLVWVLWNGLSERVQEYHAFHFGMIISRNPTLRRWHTASGTLQVLCRTMGSVALTGSPVRDFYNIRLNRKQVWNQSGVARYLVETARAARCRF